MNCTEIKTLFADAYYGELNETARIAFEEHIALCAECAAAYHAMNDLLNLMAKHEVPEPSQEFLSSYWETLQPKLSPESGKEVAPARPMQNGTNVLRFPALNIPRWVYGIAAMALIAVGVYIGRMVPGSDRIQSNTTASRGVASDSTKTATDDDVQNYLDRSRALLLGVVNNESASPEMLEHQRTVSRELAQKAVYLKSTLKAGDDQSLRKLIGDLEVVLLQLANYSNDTGIPVVELVRQGVDQKSIMLKINIEQIRALTAREKPPASTSAKTRKTGI